MRPRTAVLPVALAHNPCECIDRPMHRRGSGDFLTRVMPAPVDSLAQTTVLSLVCGSRTTLALDREGRVFAWGKGDDGQLGIGERGTVARPRLVTALLRHPIAQVRVHISNIPTPTPSPTSTPNLTLSLTSSPAEVRMCWRSTPRDRCGRGAAPNPNPNPTPTLPLPLPPTPTP